MVHQERTKDRTPPRLTHIHNAAGQPDNHRPEYPEHDPGSHDAIVPYSTGRRRE